MSAPAYVIAPAPKTSLYTPVDYQCAVNRALLASTRPLDRTDHRPLLSDAELDEMDTAYSLGLSAGDFATRLAARDRATGSEP